MNARQQHQCCGENVTDSKYATMLLATAFAMGFEWGDRSALGINVRAGL
jgi:hypothetical protein